MFFLCFFLLCCLLGVFFFFFLVSVCFFGLVVCFLVLGWVRRTPWKSRARHRPRRPTKLALPQPRRLQVALPPLPTMPQGVPDTPSPVRPVLRLLSDGEVETPPPAKRVRLREKTTVPSPSPAQEALLPAALPASDMGEEEPPVDGGNEADWELTTFLKKKFHNAYHHWWTAKVSYRTLPPRSQQRYHGFYFLKKLSMEERQKRVERFLKDKPELAELAHAVLRQWKVLTCRDGKGVCTGGLWTWNGPWGVLRSAAPDLEAEPLAGGGAPAEPHASSPSPTESLWTTLPSECRSDQAPSLDPEAEMKRTERAARSLRSDARALELWEEVRKTVAALNGHQKGLITAWALEVCPRTLESTGELRVHVHVAAYSTRGRLSVNPMSLLFMDQTCSDFSREAGGGQRARRMTSGIAYLALPKVCTVFAGCSQQLFTDFPISAQCVFNGVQAGKILVQTAHELLCRIPRSIDRNLEQLARYRTEQGNLAVERVMAWRRHNGHEHRAAWRYNYTVLQWMAQYSVVLDRYQFLVLDGPSRMGKTGFARSLVQPDEFLEVSLAGGAAIDLRSYRMWQHTLVLFDEAEPQQILDQKKLFQAGPMPVQLQTSTTNCHAYSAYVGGKMMVICSNVWAERMVRLSPADVEWLQRNSVYVHVTSPMWVQSPQDRVMPDWRRAF